MFSVLFIVLWPRYDLMKYVQDVTMLRPRVNVSAGKPGTVKELGKAWVHPVAIQLRWTTIQWELTSS